MIGSTDDLPLLVNTPAQAKSLLHSLEQAAGGISLNKNANKTEFMCLNKKEPSKWQTSKISRPVHIPQ